MPYNAAALAEAKERATRLKKLADDAPLFIYVPEPPKDRRVPYSKYRFEKVKPNSEKLYYLKEWGDGPESVVKSLEEALELLKTPSQEV